MQVKRKTKTEKWTKQEALDASLEYFGGDELAATVWVNKYALKDAEGNLYERTPADMHRRIAREVARIEANYPNPMGEDEVFGLLDGFRYVVPQGSPMAGIGNDLQVVSLSNCFVVGAPEGSGDSYGAIMRTDEMQIQLMKRRCGVGHDLSEVRPAGTPVANAAITSTGIVPFMERYSNSTREVAQGGRRGALMLTVSMRHPEAGAFIDAKMDTTKVTGANVSVRVDDEFMRAVEAESPYLQQWPVTGEPRIVKEVDAKELWGKVIHNAWKSAEPGVLFWDRIIEESPADCYADQGFRTVSTNPCVVAETPVAVADGRGIVTMGQLAKEGRDVPVFSLGAKGKVEVRVMRNPRVTGENVRVFKVTLDDGTEMRLTGNHKLLMRDGSYAEVKDMRPGDSLFVGFRDHFSLKDIWPNCNSRSQDYTWFSTCERKTKKAEHRLIAEHYHGGIPKHHVVHHVDYNAQNNRPENLVVMSKANHDKLHSQDMIGGKNPIHGILADPVKGPAYRAKMSESTTGELNGRYSGHSDEEVLRHAVELTHKLGRRFSRKEWHVYADIKGLPKGFTDFRRWHNVYELSMEAADSAGLTNQAHDPRILRTLAEAEAQGYDAWVDESMTRRGLNHVRVNKACEECGSSFDTHYNSREVSFCSTACSNSYLNRTTDVNGRRTASLNATYRNKGEEKRDAQLKIYKDLEFVLGRDPKLKEFEASCKEVGVPYRLKTKHGFGSFAELKEEAADHNHRIVSVEPDGFATVYNGTVDANHNFMIVGADTQNDKGKKRNPLIISLQCGELPLCTGDSCRLLALNLYGYVRDPFTPRASFDWDLFRDHARKAQRIMDDIVDLELEKIDRILAKIDSDPEDESVKGVERDMWTEIREKCRLGRRTGTGVTAEGDMLAAMGLRYGTPEATALAVEVHKTLALEAYRSSVEMAAERGAFPLWDLEKEKDNPFLSRLVAEDPELGIGMEETGRRNIALLTIAPTGSVSIMTQTTSGVECAFLVAYQRRRKVNPGEPGTRVTFVDEVGDSWEEFQVFHHHFRTWLEANGYDPEEVRSMPPGDLQDVIERSPYHGALSNDVDWVEKVHMQGAIQKWVDHSISVTVNLPNGVDEELVDRVYREAWRSGCKGCTVYRDGSRSGVLVSNEEKKQEDSFADVNAPKRPKSLDCVVTRFQNKGERWIGFIGLLDGRPYEIFTGALDDFPVPGYVEEGRIFKEKSDGKSRYQFAYVDRSGTEIVMPNLNHAFNREYYDMSKTISAILRHGMPLPYVIDLIEGLNLDGDLINTWKAGVKRMLKKFVKDGTSAAGSCPECGSKDLQYKEGCVTCVSCGNSKCG